MARRSGVIDRDNAAVFDFDTLIRKRRPAATDKQQFGMDRISIRHVRAFRQGHLDDLLVRCGTARFMGHPAAAVNSTREPTLWK